MELDDEKKESIGKYANPESEEEWGALEAFNAGYTWDEFRKKLLDISAAERGTPARLFGRLTMSNWETQ